MIYNPIFFCLISSINFYVDRFLNIPDDDPFSKDRNMSCDATELLVMKTHLLQVMVYDL